MPRKQAVTEITEAGQEQEQPKIRSGAIERIVQMRAGEDARATRNALENFDDIQTANRNLDALRTEEIYLLGISVGVGVGRLTIDCGEIEINPGMSDAIARAEGRWTITLPVYKELSKKGTQLSTRRSKIQKKYLRFARPYWYCSRADLPALRDEIFGVVESDRPQDKGLLQLADELRAEALDTYDEAFGSFLENLEEVLLRAGKFSEDELEGLLQKYAEQFPSRQDILNSFGVTLEGPIKIPSLAEEANSNADIAEAIAREQAAQITAKQQEVDQQRIADEQAAIAQLQQFWIQSVQESFAVGIKQAQDDAYGLIADILASVEGIEEPGKLHGNLRKRLDGKLRELQTAVNAIAAINDGEFDQHLPAFAEKVKQIKTVADSAIAPESLQQRLQGLREEMLGELSAVKSSTRKGHRALAQWMIQEEE